MGRTSLTPGEHLAEIRRSRRLSQSDLARALDVTRTLVSAWENDHRRPRGDHLTALTEALGDDGTLVRRFTDPDRGMRTRLFDDPTTVTVLVQRTVDRLIGFLPSERTRDGQSVYGWRYDMDDAGAPPLALSTAYGLKAVLIAGARDWRVSLPRIRATLRDLELDEGGWTVGTLPAVEPIMALPEVSAVIVSALHDAGESDDYVAERAALVIDALRRDVQGTVPARPYVLATSLFELSRLAVDVTAARGLIDDLVDLSLDDGGHHTWPVRVRGPSLAPITPSPVHTAIVVCALAAWARRLDDARISEIALSGAAWLERSQDLSLEDETLWRQGDDGLTATPVPVREFTPAWIVRALLATGRDAGSAPVTRALHEMFRYHLADVDLWHWPRGGGLVPVWMTYNAVAALVAWAGAHEIG
ncbi:MAG: helix-turn-helix domain-containing protein [Acidimicrobiales bacterium]